MKITKSLFVLSVLAHSIAADPSLEGSFSVRGDRKFGFQVLHMGAPYRQVLGVAGAVNFMRKARARLIYAPGLASRGAQSNDTLHTLVASLDGFLLDRSLSPMFSLQSAFTNGAENFGSVFGRNARHLLIAVGADFLRSDGLNAGAAVNLPINEPVSGISFYLGWHSNLF